MMTPVDYIKLEQRLGTAHISQRLSIQIHYAAKSFTRRATLFHVENMYGVLTLFEFFLKITGLYGWGNRNFKDIQIERHDWEIHNLPDPFDGYTIMQLSDLHLDIDDELPDAIVGAMKKVDSYDICVMTGDYRWRTIGPHDQSIQGLKKIAQYIDRPTYAVIGNHDFIEVVPDLEALGLTVLLNEMVTLEKSGEQIYLIGTDDPYFYLLDYLDKSINAISNHYTVKILLTHAPEVYQKAAHLGIDLMLCGHTHGGQICLPGGFAPLLNSSAPRKYCSGAWEHLDLQGFTSRGTGGSGIPVRYFCPPEITLHTLKKKRNTYF